MGTAFLYHIPNRYLLINQTGLLHEFQAFFQSILAVRNQNIGGRSVCLISAAVCIGSIEYAESDDQSAVWQRYQHRVCNTAISAGCRSDQCGKAGILTKHNKVFGCRIYGIIDQYPDISFVWIIRPIE